MSLDVGLGRPLRRRVAGGGDAERARSATSPSDGDSLSRRQGAAPDGRVRAAQPHQRRAVHAARSDHAAATCSSTSSRRCRRRCCRCSTSALKTGGVLLPRPERDAGEIGRRVRHHRRALAHLPQAPRRALARRAPAAVGAAAGDAAGRGILAAAAAGRAAALSLLRSAARARHAAQPPRRRALSAGAHASAGRVAAARQRRARDSTNVLDLVRREPEDGAPGSAAARAQGAHGRAARRHAGDDRRRAARSVGSPSSRSPSNVGGDALSRSSTRTRAADGAAAADGSGGRGARGCRATTCSALESELRFTKESLQATIEELETANEELQATNEELVASNEELQSTNEELHSVNEELYTVNVEHQRKIAQLDRDDRRPRQPPALDRRRRPVPRREAVHPQVHAADGETSSACCRRTSGGASTTSRRPSSTPGCEHDVRAVLRERRADRARGGEPRGISTLLRILPYRSTSAKRGVVLTLIDITRSSGPRRTCAGCRRSPSRRRDAITAEDLNGACDQLESRRRDAVRLLRRRGDRTRCCRCSFPPTSAAEWMTAPRRAQLGEVVAPHETARVRKDGTPVDVQIAVSPLHDEHDKSSARRSIARDITQRRARRGGGAQRAQAARSVHGHAVARAAQPAGGALARVDGA